MNLRAWWRGLPRWKQSMVTGVVLLVISVVSWALVKVTIGGRMGTLLAYVGVPVGFIIGSLIRRFLDRNAPSPRDG